MVCCYDVAIATMYNDGIQINQNQSGRLYRYCSMIDQFAYDADGISYEVLIDRDSMDITVSIVTGSYEIERGSQFFALVAASKYIEIACEDAQEDLLKTTFVFDWEILGE